MTEQERIKLEEILDAIDLNFNNLTTGLDKILKDYQDYFSGDSIEQAAVEIEEYLDTQIEQLRQELLN